MSTSVSALSSSVWAVSLPVWGDVCRLWGTSVWTVSPQVVGLGIRWLWGAFCVGCVPLVAGIVRLVWVVCCAVLVYSVYSDDDVGLWFTVDEVVGWVQILVHLILIVCGLLVILVY